MPRPDPLTSAGHCACRYTALRGIAVGVTSGPDLGLNPPPRPFVGLWKGLPRGAGGDAGLLACWDAEEGTASCDTGTAVLLAASSFDAQHFLYLLPDPQWQGSFLPSFTICLVLVSRCDGMQRRAPALASRRGTLWRREGEEAVGTDELRRLWCDEERRTHSSIFTQSRWGASRGQHSGEAIVRLGKGARANKQAHGEIDAEECGHPVKLPPIGLVRQGAMPLRMARQTEPKSPNRSLVKITCSAACRGRAIRAYIYTRRLRITT